MGALWPALSTPSYSINTTYWHELGASNCVFVSA
eukprot:SAG11_NODE_9852_length_875_cov_21.918814_2_plen_33_part_01